MGTRATLRLMSNLVKQYKTSLEIRETALDLIRHLPQKAWAAEAAALFAFVRDDIRYVRDVTDVETVATPVKTLEYGQGDCDDKSVLLAALLESIGHPSAFVAIGYSPDSFVHVYVQSRINKNWVGMETTEPWPMGKRPTGLPYRMVQFN